MPAADVARALERELRAEAQRERLQRKQEQAAAAIADIAYQSPDMQDAIMKHLRRTATMQDDMPVDDIDSIIPKAVLHNLQLTSPSAKWIDLDAASRGLVHVAKLLIKKLQDQQMQLYDEARFEELTARIKELEM